MWGYRHTRTHTQKKLLVGYSFAFLFFKKTAMGKVPLISLLCAQTVQSSDSTSWYDVAQFRKAEIGCWDASGRRYTSMSVGGWIVVVCTICGRYFCSWERPRLLNHRFFFRAHKERKKGPDRLIPRDLWIQITPLPFPSCQNAFKTLLYNLSDVSLLSSRHERSISVHHTAICLIFMQIIHFFLESYLIIRLVFHELCSPY